MGLIGALVGGVAGLGQGLMQRQTDRLNANRNFDQNMKMAQYQYSKDLEMWNKANEYNSPAQQMARYQSAGLNPNLIYGSGTASAGNTSTTLPKYQAPQYQQDYKPIMDLPTTIGMFQNFAMKQAQIDNLREQRRILSNTADIKAYDAMAYGSIAGEHDRSKDDTIPMRRRALLESQIARTQADALRSVTDNAIKNISLQWMKKLGVTNLGGLINAFTGLTKILR